MTDPDHPILEKPWTCEIAQFEWSAGSDDVPSVLDVTFVRDGSSRRLRFIDPQDVTLEFSGRFPIQCGEMAILDVRDRQLDGLGVQVAEYGASGTPLRLYARAVVDAGTL
jgi:hypothetical protein